MQAIVPAQRRSRSPPMQTLTTPCRATSAAAAPISAFVRPSKLPRRDAHERHRQCQPTRIPARRAFHWRLRSLRAIRSRRSLGRRSTGTLTSISRFSIPACTSESIPTERSTSSRIALRWEPRSRTSLPLVLADELDADWSRVKVRAGDRRSALRLAGYRRLPLHPRILSTHAGGRRHRAPHADPRGRATVGRAGSGVHDGPARRGSQSQR